jgi:hypothetical protein
VVCAVMTSESVSVEIVRVLPYGGFIQIHDWFVLKEYVC